MDRGQAQHRAFVRRMLDAALADADMEVVGDPLDCFNHGNPLPLSRRFVRAVHEAGWEFRIDRPRYKNTDGVRTRMEIEDMIDTALIATGWARMKMMLARDPAIAEGARAELTARIHQRLQQDKVVVRRRRRD